MKALNDILWADIPLPITGEEFAQAVQEVDDNMTAVVVSRLNPSSPMFVLACVDIFGMPHTVARHDGAPNIVLLYKSDVLNRRIATFPKQKWDIMPGGWG